MIAAPIVLTLPFDVPPLSSNSRVDRHEKARLTRQIRESAYWVAKQADIAPAEPAAVLTVWFPPTRRRRDAGSCAPTTKAAAVGSRKNRPELVECERDRVRANASRSLTHSLEQARRG